VKAYAPLKLALFGLELADEEPKENAPGRLGLEVVAAMAIEDEERLVVLADAMLPLAVRLWGAPRRAHASSSAKSV
jgi:hypothetical protein